MRKTTTKRKANTAMVFNPNRGLSLGRSTVRKSAARKNPVRKLATVNPRRKRHVKRHRNPATGGGLFIAAFMAAVGVSLFDIATQKVIPQTSPLVRVGVKLGGAWLFQSSIGAKIPVLGKHKNDIALVLAVSGGIDLLKLYVLPLVSQTVAGITGGNLVLIAPPAQAADAAAGMGAVYGNTPYQPSAGVYIS